MAAKKTKQSKQPKEEITLYKGTGYPSLTMPDGHTYFHLYIEHFEENEEFIDTARQLRIQWQAQMKARYVSNFLRNVKLYNLTSLQEGLEYGLMPPEEKVKMLSDALVETLNQKIGTGGSFGSLAEIKNDANMAVNDIVDTGKMSNFSKLFDAINRGVDLLGDPDFKVALAAVLSGRITTNRLNAMITQLDAALQTQSMAGGLVTLTERELGIVRTLRNLLDKALQSINTGGVKSINKQSMRTSLTDIFSTKTGEFIIASGVSSILGEQFSKIESHLTGSKNVDIKLSDDLKFFEQFGSQSKVSKTDVKANNFRIQVSKNGISTIDINLGLTVKWYKEEEGQAVKAVKITEETYISERISQIFGGSRQQHMAYNALGLSDEDVRGYEALKALIAARNLDYMFAGLGGRTGDFSQFLVVNGKFFSIYDIIVAFEQYTTGIGASNSRRLTENDFLTISASGLKTATDEIKAGKQYPPNLTRAFGRSRKMNSEFVTGDKIGFKMELHTAKLTQLLANNTPSGN